MARTVSGSRRSTTATSPNRLRTTTTRRLGGVRCFCKQPHVDRQAPLIRIRQTTGTSALVETVECPDYLLERLDLRVPHYVRRTKAVGGSLRKRILREARLAN